MATSIAIAVVQQGGRFLIGRRAQGRPLAGLWEFPGGRVEPSESPEEAAVRECREETGLAVEVTGLLCCYDHQYEHDRLQLHFFSCRPRSAPAVPREPFRWVRRDELRGYAFPAGNDRLLSLLVAADRRQPAE